jgi:hypothetical protein
MNLFLSFCPEDSNYTNQYKDSDSKYQTATPVNDWFSTFSHFWKG